MRRRRRARASTSGVHLPWRSCRDANYYTSVQTCARGAAPLGEGRLTAYAGNRRRLVNVVRACARADIKATRQCRQRHGRQRAAHPCAHGAKDSRSETERPTRGLPIPKQRVAKVHFEYRRFCTIRLSEYSQYLCLNPAARPFCPKHARGLPSGSGSRARPAFASQSLFSPDPRVPPRRRCLTSSRTARRCPRPTLPHPTRVVICVYQADAHTVALRAMHMAVFPRSARMRRHHTVPGRNSAP